jgi:predicted NUDIX family NTP pyrophosphohydrolase
MKKSAGIMLYRRVPEGLQVLLVHPGGPFWAKRDDGAWSIPKGEYGSDELALTAAVREFSEELGKIPPGTPHPLGEVRQNSSKTVTAFALEGEFDIGELQSNRFEMEWPPKSGKIRSFPEVDRAGWFALPVARQKIVPGQRPFLDLIEEMTAGPRA